MNTLKGAKLKAIDRRLVRGLFLRKLNDFDEDYKEIIQNRSLLSRITDEINFKDQLTFRNSYHGETDSPFQGNYESDFKSALEQYKRRRDTNSNEGISIHSQYNSNFGDKKQAKIQSTIFNQKAYEYDINQNRKIEERKQEISIGSNRGGFK